MNTRSALLAAAIVCTVLACFALCESSINTKQNKYTEPTTSIGNQIEQLADKYRANKDFFEVIVGYAVFCGIIKTIKKHKQVLTQREQTFYDGLTILTLYLEKRIQRGNHTKESPEEHKAYSTLMQFCTIHR